MGKWQRALYQPNLPLYEGQGKVTASPEHIRISKDAAKEGMVLLKNEGILPLKEGSKIALFGKGTIDYVKGGGGSGDVTVPYVRNIAEGFAQLSGIVSVFEEGVSFYRREVEKQYGEGIAPGMVKEPELPDELVRRASVFTDTAVISISRFSGEGWDRKSIYDTAEQHKGVERGGFVDQQNALFERGDFYLSNAEQAMVEKVKNAFDKVIVVLNVGGVVDTSWFRGEEKIGAALLAWQSGMEGGLAEAELLMGIGNPSGKLADTFAGHLEDYPSADTFFDSDDYVNYYEDIYVGYRYFETIPGAAQKVVYPFGYGLSYTTFRVSEPALEKQDGAHAATVCVTVTNTGAYAGKEVIQVYVTAPQGVLGKPAKQLIGYRKTRLLAPGESQEIDIPVCLEDAASYDDLGKIQKSAWILEKGSYTFFVGTSVRDGRYAAEAYELADDVIVRQCTELAAPTSLPYRLRADGSREELPQREPHDTDYSALGKRKENEMEFPITAQRATERFQYIFAEKKEFILSDVYEGNCTMEQFMAQLTDEDLAWLVGGQPNKGPANTFGIGNNLKFGIPNAMTADGPAGVRFQEETGLTTTAFPCATLLACTFDPEVTYRIGRTGAEELIENNMSVWLTPAVNIHRTPLCGRNFEYYSEDPFLTGKQAAAMVRGIQSMGAAASVKHFALNNKETNRKNSDSRASERAIREIYIRQFEIIVKEADPWTIMSSYNIINGRRASENSDLLTGVLRGEWDFQGMVTSDWWTFGEHYKEMAAGNDLRMPCGYPERIMKALEAGVISRAQLETAAGRILGMLLKIR